MLRDLDVSLTIAGNCTTWYTRKPSAYYSYSASEFRNSLYASSITYNAGIDTYSLAYGSGNWTDKETIIALIPTSGTRTSRISLNGNTAIPITGWGDDAVEGAGNFPHAGTWATFTYDATFNVAMMGGGFGGNHQGLSCGMPPEAFININNELHTDPWIVAYPLTLDPATDYYVSYAQYIKTNFPGMVPEFEATDEPWNNVPCYYGSAKSSYYHSIDPAWPSRGPPHCGPAGNIPAWVGKIGSILGQMIASVYGSSPYVVMSDPQTANGAAANWGEILKSTAYVNQTVIPVQRGCAGASSAQVCPTFTQSAAANWLTDISVATYFGTCEQGTQREIADGYNYYNGKQTTQTDIVAAYIATNEVTNTCPNGGQAAMTTVYSSWGHFVSACGGFVGTCRVRHMRAYEGGFSLGSPDGLYGSDKTVAITGTNNSKPCELTAAAGDGVGAVNGMPVALSDITETGGTYWAELAAGGALSVGNGTSTTIPLNRSGRPVDCTSEDTLKRAKLTYTGSATYMNTLRTAVYIAPQLYSLTLLNNQIWANAGGLNPSQFNLANALGSGTWFLLGDDIYGYYRSGTCSGCTISGRTLTLGGTIKGLFKPGQLIAGKGVTENSAIVSGTGKSPGDSVTLSQSSTISSGENMFSLIAPPKDCSGNGTNSPSPAFAAFRAWNGSLCNDP